MKIEIIGRGPITPAQLDEILFGTSTINKKNPLEEAMDKLLNEVKCDNEKCEAPICFDIQSITANHKKNAFTVVWGDGSHTIVHLQKGDVWDDEKALAMCFVKHMMGDKGNFNDIFTEELPAKIKHIGKVEPAEEKHECKCSGRREEGIHSCKDCTCGVTSATGGNIGGFNIEKKPIEKATESLKKAGTAATKSTKDVIGLSAEIEGLLKKLAEEPVEIKRYNLLLVEPGGTEKEICYNCTDGEIHKAMRAYRIKHYPILEANGTPYRVWQRDGSLFVDFGAGSYFKVPGMDHDTFVKGK
jgi:hypothetical protein